MSYLYGFDLSLNSSGVAIFDMKTLRPVYVSIIPTDDKMSDGKRLYWIAKYISDLRRQYPPTAIAIEDTFLATGAQKNVQSKAKLDKVHGVINFLFHDVNQRYYTASEWKAKVLAGNATKKMIRDVVSAKYPEVIFNSEAKGKDGYDDSDAFGICLAWLIENKLIEWEKTVRPQKSKPIKKPLPKKSAKKKPSKEAMQSLKGKK